MAPGKRQTSGCDWQPQKKNKFSPDDAHYPGCQNLCPKNSYFIQKSEISGIELIGNNLVITFEPFECPLCLDDIEIGRGVRLKNCNHRFCRKCIVQQIKIAEERKEKVRCPFYSLCPEFLQDKEIVSIKDSRNFDWSLDKINAFLKKVEIPSSSVAFQPLKERLVSGSDQKIDKKLESTTCIQSSDFFKCPLCLKYIDPELGIALFSCEHCFCRDCLVKVIEESDTFEVLCPFKNCDCYLKDIEIKTIVSSDVYQAHLAKGLALAKKNMKTLHCSTPNCPMWYECEGDISEFNCPQCRQKTCVKCRTHHSKPEDCKSALNARISQEKEEALTLQMLKDLVSKDKALQCPYCKAFILKNDDPQNIYDVLSDPSDKHKGYCGWCKKNF